MDRGATGERAARLLSRAERELERSDLEAAATSLGRASQIEPVSPADHARRIDAMTRLGRVLERLGRLDEAEDVLRQALGQRAALWGVEHPGYALGLEPLAALELSRGRASHARCLAEHALHVLFEAGHPRSADLVALRAFAAVAEGLRAREPFAFAELLDDRAFEQMVRKVLDRAEFADPRRALAVLLSLRSQVLARRGPDDELTLHFVTAISNRAADAGDHGERARALAWLVDALDRRGDAVQAVDAVLGLALAESDAGALVAAEERYREALARSAELTPALQSDVCRNFGLFLAGVQRALEAEALLRDAARHARSAGQDMLLGRARVALGIFWQHAADRARARSALEAGLSLLAPTDPDAHCARAHLEALLRQTECGCRQAAAAPSEPPADSTTRVISAGAPRRIGGPQ